MEKGSAVFNLSKGPEIGSSQTLTYAGRNRSLESKVGTQETLSQSPGGQLLRASGQSPADFGLSAAAAPYWAGLARMTDDAFERRCATVRMTVIPWRLDQFGNLTREIFDAAPGPGAGAETPRRSVTS